MIRKKKYCEVCKKELLTNSDICSICLSELKKSRKYCEFCERDLIVETNICPICGNIMFDFRKYKMRVKCLNCLVEFCTNEIIACPDCQSEKLEEIECPCVYYPRDCVLLFKNL